MHVRGARSLAAAVLAAAAAATPAEAYSTGIFDVARPEAGCSCHSMVRDAPTTLLRIDGLPDEGYRAGETYDLEVTVIGVAFPAPGLAPFDPHSGFNLEITGGTLETPDGRTFVLNETLCQRRLRQGCVPGDSLFPCPAACDDPQSVESTLLLGQATHNYGDPAVSPGVSWELRWEAPPPGTGPVLFYLAGNAVNGNDQPDPLVPGDLWATADPDVDPGFRVPEAP